MSPLTSRLFLVIANVLIPIAIIVFAVGFFPYKPFLPGLAQADERHGARPDAHFDKVVFMVVDALRSDFVYGEESGFKFTQSLITQGAALPFTAHATSPTITMPRVKAMTTGSVPSFLDVILNFAESDTSSTLADQDTWLAQMKAKDTGGLLMYGDDTWLKLFPDTFMRSDGTSSFFVSDFTEVDNNVTRHIPDELKTSDWNTMVMHYLGLDHIGHKAGPRSPNMRPKQEEMDDMVKEIYGAIQREAHLSSTLLVLSGDHGMNDAGNHGGSAAGETSPALVFMSPRFKSISSGNECPAQDRDGNLQFYTTVEQSDIVPTLGGLLDFPVPRNNLGVFIPEFLPLWKGPEKIRLLLANAEQILEIVKATFPSPSWEERRASTNCETGSLSGIDELACLWKQVSAITPDGHVAPDQVQRDLELLDKWSRHAQEIMSSTASNYDMSKLSSGILLAGVTAIASCIACFSSLRSDLTTSLVLLSTTFSYGGMMFASSYVEEEQHFWYWAASGWFVFLGIRDIRNSKQTKSWNGTLPQGISSLLLLAALRVLRRWNQTGQKHAGAADIGRTFFLEHNFAMWILVVATYMDITRRISSGRGFRRASIELASLTGLTVSLASAGFKAAFTYADSPELLRDLPPPMLNGLARAPLVAQARTVFLAILFVLAYVFLWDVRVPPRPRGGRTRLIIHDLLSVFLITQSRVANVPAFLLFEVMLLLLSDLSLSPVSIGLTSLLLQYVSFFALGGSNAISSIDLSNAYNGVSGYNVLGVGILTFVSNWAGPIWWVSATGILAKQSPQGGGRAMQVHSQTATLFVTTSLLFVMAACTALRTHLFIWTVFSPKFLYAMAWSLAQHAINLLVTFF